MVLKGPSCSHMIVIIHCEAGKRETRRKHSPADTDLVFFCMFYVQTFASSIGLLLILHFRILCFSTPGFGFSYRSVRLQFFPPDSCFYRISNLVQQTGQS